MFDAELEIARIQRISNGSRTQELGFDLHNAKLDLYEGQVGQLVEHSYGYFRRAPDVSGDFQSISGAYKNKIFDAFGIPMDKIKYHTDNLDLFLPSVDSHFYKIQSGAVDYLLLDARAMNSTQKLVLNSYIENNWSSLIDKLILIN